MVIQVNKACLRVHGAHGCHQGSRIDGLLALQRVHIMRTQIGGLKIGCPGIDIYGTESLRVMVCSRRDILHHIKILLLDLSRK
jgi:hypothetical protein